MEKVEIQLFKKQKGFCISDFKMSGISEEYIK